MALTVDFYYGLGSRYADLAALASEAGLDAAVFRAQLADLATAELHEAALQAAHRRGAFGVPTFFLGERMFWGNNRLVLLEHALPKARACGPQSALSRLQQFGDNLG